MKNKKKAMVLASFVGDSLALGVHWIYDTKRIGEEFGRVESFLKPGPDSFHPTKEKGEFTHYGDQMLVLLESVAEHQGFDPEDFADRWRTLFKKYDGYIDNATRVTLANYKRGKSYLEAGSNSMDFAGASRIAPLAYFIDNLDALISASRTQASLTHNNSNVIESAEFFARVIYQTLRGSPPSQAIEHTVTAYLDTVSPIREWIEKGLGSVRQSSIEAIEELGQSCDVEDCLPSVIHLIAKYEDNLKEAMIQNVMAGGDSAVRAHMIGAVLGAHLGFEAIPSDWLNGLQKKHYILSLLSVHL